MFCSISPLETIHNVMEHHSSRVMALAAIRRAIVGRKRRKRRLSSRLIPRK